VDVSEIEKLLIGTQYEIFIGTFQRITLKNYMYENLFKIGNDNLGFFALKLRKNTEKNILNSINSLALINDKENFIHEYSGIVEKEGFIILISKWLDGIQPIDDKKDTLPNFFSKLAVFNKSNIIEGPFTSMYLDGKRFESINDLVEWEVNYQLKYYPKNLETKIIIDILKNLKKGFPCIINEDMNCGNFFITNDGAYKIIDTEWIIGGINLYQFQHFDYFGFNGKKWYTITEEAENCYKEYFDVLELSKNEANEQIRAIELLNVLRENTYWKCSGKEDDKEIERRIETVLEKEKYI